MSALLRKSHHFLWFQTCAIWWGRPAASGNQDTLTFLAVVLVVVQHEAAAALTAVASEGIHALMLAASVFFGTLVDICRIAE